MLKSFFALLACLPILLSLHAPAAAPPSYAGTWKLVREKSDGLTGGLAGADVQLVVKQDAEKIYVEQIVTIRGRRQPSQELIWRLDGSESSADVSRPLAGSMTLKARWLEGLKTLELYSSISGDDQGKEVAVVTKESWELLQNGKALRISRTRNAPQGRHSSKLWFEKSEE